MPVLYIITGSNGAGKSTVGPDYLPEPIRSQGAIFDGDKLFMQKSSEFWRLGVKSHKECKKMAIEYVANTFDVLVETALIEHADFTYEGHFTNEATWDIPRRFKLAGYEIHIIFFGLADTDISELRVVARANEGGHYVDPQTIAANFFGNLEKLDQHFGMFNSVQIVDTSESEHKVLALFQNGIPVSAVSLALLPLWFTLHLPRVTECVRMMQESKKAGEKS